VTNRQPAPTDGEPGHNLLDIEARLRLRPSATGVITLLMLGATCWLRAVAADQADVERLLLRFAVMPSQMLGGELWRAVTGTWLHESWIHLLVNIVALVFAGRLVEALYGPIRTWLLFALSALGGTIGTTLAGVTLSVGASGAVFGLLAALVVGGVRLRAHLAGRSLRLVLVIPAAALGASLLMELLSTTADRAGIDAAAHIAGALTGGTFAALTVDTVSVELGLRTTKLVGWRPGHLVERSWAVVLVAMQIGAVVTALGSGGSDINVATTAIKTVRVDELRVTVPRDYSQGVWRAGSCDGTAVSVQWALSTDRIACFALPMGGWLLFGRRNQLLTMDADDVATMKMANRQRQFVRRQPQIMLFPIAAEWLFIVVASEGLHAPYNEALNDLLQAAEPATIAATETRAPTVRPLPLAERVR
jgi:membrane associated rhomboid family serine protease